MEQPAQQRRRKKTGGGARMKQDEMNYVASSFNITSWWFSSPVLFLANNRELQDVGINFFFSGFSLLLFEGVKCLNRRIKVNRLGCYLV